MFERFLSKFNQDNRVKDILSNEVISSVGELATGFSEFMKAFSGSTFEGGLYRLHRTQDIPFWTKNVELAFPEYENRIICFSFDWLGRHFALDKKRVENNQMLILLLEPGAGEVMQIPVSFVDFHNNELVEYRNDALASDFFKEWLNSNKEGPSHSKCVGYKIPLSLGGVDELDNLEMSDMDVYWSICGQVINNATVS